MTQRPILKKQYPEMKNSEISKLLGSNWQREPAHVRQPHIDREAREREVYKKKIHAWREEKELEEKAAREQRVEVAKQYARDLQGTDGGYSDPSTAFNADVDDPEYFDITDTPHDGIASESFVPNISDGK